MDMHVTYGFMMFFLVLVLDNIKAIPKGIALGLYLIALGLQICDIWLNKSIQEAKSCAPWDKDAICIFSDCRYPNEIARVKQEMYNVITMRVERNGVKALKDDSETSLDNYGNWDIVVENNGSLEEFRSKIVEVVKCYLK